MPKVINGINYLTLADVAEIMECKPSTIQTWVKNGKFPAPARVGYSRLWTGKVISQFIEQQQAGAEEIQLTVYRALQPMREQARLKIARFKEAHANALGAVA